MEGNSFDIDRFQADLDGGAADEKLISPGRNALECKLAQLRSICRKLVRVIEKNNPSFTESVAQNLSSNTESFVRRFDPQIDGAFIRAEQ